MAMHLPTQRFEFPDGSEYRWVYDATMPGKPHLRWRWEDASGQTPPNSICRELRDMFIQKQIPIMNKILDQDGIALLDRIRRRMKSRKYDTSVVDGAVVRTPIRCRGCGKTTTDYYPDTRLCPACHEAHK